MANYLEGVAKYNDVSGWRHTLGKLRVFFDTASTVDSKEKTSGADCDDKGWEEEMKERLSGGRWW
jgi:hypothetical protein